MNAKLRVLFFIALGVACIVIGIDMKDKQIRWSETSDNTTNIPGTKNRNALIGVGTGAASGGDNRAAGSPMARLARMGRCIAE